MEPIKYRKTYDRTGAFEGLQLIQGDNVIDVSLGTKGTHFAGYRWVEIKNIVDRFQQEATDEVIKMIKE